MTLDVNTEKMRLNLQDHGASLVGFADLSGFLTHPFVEFTHGVSIGVRLSESIINELAMGPTKAYAYHYHAINRILDDLAVRAMNIFQKWGFKAFPIPTSQTLNLEQHEGHLSHKMVATRAGLGWIGKNALLVTPEYGPRVRLTSILTNAIFDTGKAIEKSQCGTCQACVTACPVKAIHGKTWSITSKRADLLDVDLCAKRIDKAKAKLGAPVCGVCIRACPKGDRIS